MDPKLFRMYSDILSEVIDPRYANQARADAAKKAANAPPTQTFAQTFPQAVNPAVSPESQRLRTAFGFSDKQKELDVAGSKIGAGYNQAAAAGAKPTTTAATKTAPQGARATPKSAAPAIDPRVAAARKADAARQVQTIPGGGPSSAAELARAQGKEVTAAEPAASITPDQMRTATAVKPSDIGFTEPSAAAPSGVFSGKGDLSGGSMAAREVPQQAARPASSYGGGYDPSQAQYAYSDGQAARPSSGPAVSAGGGQLQSAGGGVTSRDFNQPQFNTFGQRINEYGQDLEEEIEQSIQEELEEAFSEMLRLSGLKLNEQSEFSQRMAQRMAATRAAAAGVAPGTTQTSTGTGGATMSVTKSAPASVSGMTGFPGAGAGQAAKPTQTSTGAIGMAGRPGAGLATQAAKPTQSALGSAIQSQGAGVAKPTQTSTGASGMTDLPGAGLATQPAKPTQSALGSALQTQGAGAAKPTGGFSATGQSSVDFEESIEEQLEEELAEAFNEMLRLSGIQLNEKAPPGAKAERMVKHIKKGYAKDGKLSDKEKSIAFATAWKAKKAGKLDESFRVMTDEEGHTLEHIVNRFKHETKTFLNTGEMSDNLYDALYDYYLDRGDMPYGVAKAREGDPYTWIAARFEADIDGTADVKMPMGKVAGDDTLNELARLAGLSESQVNECGDMGMDTEDRLNVSTNMSSDGTKSVNISAQGEKAEELLSMLKLAGMGSSDRPSTVMIDRDEEMMDEEREIKDPYANTPDEKYDNIETQFIGGDGEVAGKEKRMHAGGSARFSDNPLTVDQMLDEEWSALYDSILVKKDMEEGSIKGGDKPGDLTGTWSADPPKKGQPDIPPPVPMDPVYPAEKPKATSTPGIKR